jgi:hypothetical protein
LFTIPALIMVRGRASPRFLALCVWLAIIAAIAFQCTMYSSEEPGHWLQKLPWFPYMDIWFPEAMNIQGNGIGFPAMYKYFPLRIVLTILGVVGMGVLLPRVVDAVRFWRNPDLLRLFTLLQLCLLFLSPILYDRYFVALLPGFFGIAAAFGRRPVELRPGLGVPALFVSGLFSIGVTHDMLQTHSAIWRLADRAAEIGVPAQGIGKLLPQEIDGGMEWDGWYSTQPARWRYVKHVQVPKGLNWNVNQINWDHLPGFYAVSVASPGQFRRFGYEINGRIIDDEPYRLWVIPGQRHMYLLKYDPSPGGRQGRIPEPSAPR